MAGVLQHWHRSPWLESATSWQLQWHAPSLELASWATVPSSWAAAAAPSWPFRQLLTAASPSFDLAFASKVTKCPSWASMVAMVPSSEVELQMNSQPLG